MNDFKLDKSKKEAKKYTKNAIEKYSFNLTRNSLLDGIIISEILGQPKARKGLVSYNVYKSTNSR